MEAVSSTCPNGVSMNRSSVMNYYLNSYHPLVENGRGKAAIKKYRIPPYVDYSCRREPDLGSEYPSITALCRGSKFAPRLKELDVVVYMTVKSRYPCYPGLHRRLTAILKIIERFESHQLAVRWYQERELELPRNCLVKGNPPVGIDETSNPKNFDQVELWDAIYRRRSNKNGVFLVCEPLFLELYDPPIVTEGTLLAAFGRVPGTRNPPAMTNLEYGKFTELVGIQ